MKVIPAIFESFRSLKDRTYKLTFETQELTPDQLAWMGSCLNYPGYLAFNKDVFKKEQEDALKEVKVDYDNPEKSKSQRLRSVLFVLWKQHPEGYDTFDRFYDFRMEQFITHVKNKLDPDEIYEEKE